MDNNARASKLFYKGLHALSNGDLPTSEASLLEALTIVPNRPSVLTNLSVVYLRTGRLADALSLVQTAIKFDSRNPYCWLQKGAVQLALKHYGEALHSIEAVIDIDASIAEAHNNRGYALKELGRVEEALASCDKAIQLNPDYADAHNNRGVVLGQLERFAEAIESYDQAIQLNSSLAESHFNRSKALMELKCFNEALISCNNAIRLDPSVAEYYSNRGNALKEMGFFEEAIVDYDYAFHLKPGDVSARYNKASLLLSLGEFAEGFDLYKTRWDLEDCDVDPFCTGIPQWDGNPFDGNLLVWAEQGIGDEIFYASMLSLMPKLRPRITLFADKRLRAIFERSFPDVRIMNRAALNGRICSDFDAQISLVDLGSVLKLDGDKILKRRSPFLVANQEARAELLKKNMFLGRGVTCGIAWKSANKKLSRQKSIQLRDLVPFLGCLDISFINLQYGDVAKEIHDVGADFGVKVHQVAELDVFNDIDGLLALIDACDIVLTTSNVTAHLAGSIGKKAIVLVPSGVGRIWYWFGGPDCLWYPSLTLVPQGKHADWNAPIDAAVKILKERA